MSSHAHEHVADTGPVNFSAAAMKEYEAILARYPERRAALMPVLWLAQREFGWISPSAQHYVSGLMDLPMAWVEGVVSFYTMYWRRPMGRCHVAVCTNLSCYLRGAEEIYDAVCERTGVRAGEVSADGKWSVERAECLGSCDTAPMLQVSNDGYFENLTVESVLALLDRLERGEKA
ncbi:MAG TPA: NAD(P)H-dependent oxidoreductase subunit E [Candidatus Binatia bacterium]|jgi:NADH-quinone oxidoreductase E subunit